MRIAMIYNQQRSLGGGEERVVLETVESLRQRGIETDLLLRSSRGISESFMKKAQAAVLGVYNPESYSFMMKYIESARPSVVHAHNLYPQWSPSVLVACGRAGVPVVVTVHCQVLTCPTWYHLWNGAICEKCLQKGEQWCVFRNCRGSHAESAAYALRHYVVRKRQWFRKNVTVFIAPSEFMRGRLRTAGMSDDRIKVIPNAISIPEQAADPARGKYVSFAGRLSPEKGLETLLEAARKLPNIQFRIAGAGPMEAELRRHAPSNVDLTGFLEGRDLAQFFLDARLHVVPSICYDAFPVSAAEGMAFGLPIVASRIGGLPELVDDGITGVLVEPGDAKTLAEKVKDLWSDPLRCKSMGAAGRTQASSHLAKDLHLTKLLSAYEGAQRAKRLDHV